MPKIKDLVAVYVDSAFVLFPIDSERYELIAHVARYVSSLNGGPAPYPHEKDERINGFLQAMEESFLLGAQALSLDLALDSDSESMSAVSRDRALRVKLALDGTPLAGIYGPRGMDQDDLVREICLCLWLKFFVSVVAPDPYQRLSRKDRRYST